MDRMVGSIITSKKRKRCWQREEKKYTSVWRGIMLCNHHQQKYVRKKRKKRKRNRKRDKKTLHKCRDNDLMCVCIEYTN